jgi:hypothetical protein
MVSCIENMERTGLVVRVGEVLGAGVGGCWDVCSFV